ncbi:MAG: aminotransferase class III-fold pyridoxal phosphate-dependent enzyme, partial [Pseudomonadota bacterium]
HLGQALEGLKDRHPKTVVETRGRGLLRGLKLKVDPKTVQAAARNRKLLVGVAGDNVLRLAPPLILAPEHVSMAADLIDAALTDVENAA